MKTQFLTYALIAYILGHPQLVRADQDHNLDLIDDTKYQEQRSISPGEVAEAKEIGRLLDALYSSCGRYPTTAEGLRALVSKPKSLSCSKWGVEEKEGRKPYLSAVPQRWKYVSKDGSSYVIKSLNESCLQATEVCRDKPRK